MCFYTVANFSAAWLARKTGRRLDVVEAARRILEEKKQQFILEQKKKTVGRRKQPPFFEYHIAEKVFYVPGWNHPHQLIVGPNRQIPVMRWGLRPRNATPEQLERYYKDNWYINANGEKIFKEKTYPYYHIIWKQRCLIPQSGFVEHHWFSKTNKQPYYIEFPDRPDFMMAGLYEVTPIPGKSGYSGGGYDLDNPDYENYYYSFVQVTTAATPEVGKIHNGGEHPNRMPMILREQDEQLWLDTGTPMNVVMDNAEVKSLLKEGKKIPEILKILENKEWYDPGTPIETIQGLIRPYDEYPIRAWPISKKFNYMNPLAKEVLDEVKPDQELRFE